MGKWREVPPFYALLRLFGRNAQASGAWIDFISGWRDSMRFIRFQRFLRSVRLGQCLGRKFRPSCSPFFNRVGRCRPPFAARFHVFLNRGIRLRRSPTGKEWTFSSFSWRVPALPDNF